MTKKHPWIENSDVLLVFPTHVWKIQLASKAAGSANKNILRALNTVRPLPNVLQRGESWQSNQDLHRLDEFRELVSYINDTVKTILRFLKISYDAFEITGCWATINSRETAHKMHNHPNNYLSGVYYVQTQAGAGTINLHDPRIQTGIIRPPVTKLTAGNTDQVVVKVRPGTLPIFPSYLQHSVDSNTNTEERLSVSFNIMFSSFTEKLSKPLW